MIVIRPERLLVGEEAITAATSAAARGGLPDADQTERLIDAAALAPHPGGGSGGARMKQTCDTFSDLVRLQRGEPLTHVVS